MSPYTHLRGLWLWASPHRFCWSIHFREGQLSLDLRSSSWLLQSPLIYIQCSQDQHFSGLNEGMRHVSPISTEGDGNPYILLSFYRINSMDLYPFSYIFIILSLKQKSHFFLLPTRIPNDPNFLFLSLKCHTTIPDLSPSRPSSPHAHCHGMPS